MNTPPEHPEHNAPHAHATVDVVAVARAARVASRTIAALDTNRKNALLLDLRDELAGARTAILAANAQDLDDARAAALPSAKLQRLALTPVSLDQLGAGLAQIAALPDPVEQVVKDYTIARNSAMPSAGLRVRRVRAPLGVIAMIFEARPGVTIDAFALCFKSGNACILKGGKEAARSNALLASIVQAVLKRHAIDPACVASLSGISRDQLQLLLQQDQFIDLVIPRGGTVLIRFVAAHSRIPTVQHYQGVNHIFVDASADVDQAVQVCLSAKTSGPATCNAVECVLVHRDIASAFVPRMARAYRDAGVEVRASERVRALAPESRPAQTDPGDSADFGREFLDLIVVMHQVDTLDDAIAHIHRFGSNHTEAILTRSEANAQQFTRRVQASCVLVNASTRLNDGFQLGLGAEIGISTTRVHAYGPMGLEELTTTRFVCEGQGQWR
jgi:glutamate-5-semialdehyde dehydrogenase